MPDNVMLKKMFKELQKIFSIYHSYCLCFECRTCPMYDICDHLTSANSLIVDLLPDP